jgi:hypothetical protein
MSYKIDAYCIGWGRWYWKMQKNMKIIVDNKELLEHIHIFGIFIKE